MTETALGHSDSSADLYRAVVDDMHDLYNHTITESEARKAADNLIGFCRTLLEIEMENMQNSHDESKCC